MELNSEVVHTPPRPAATIVLLRDADAGLEVFMIKRSGLSDVLGDAYVFPGGKVDSNDASEGVLGRLDTPVEHLHRALGEPEIDTATAAGLFVAALRETFEEAGLLLSPGITDPRMREATAAAREGLSFADVLDRFGLELAVSGLAPWSRWITPKMPSVMRKRFDTRFFVASVPQGLEPVHDDHEATHSEWVRPRQALERYRDQEIDLAPPQIQSLAHLARHRSVADVIAEARRRLPPVVRPEPFEENGARVLTYPGDPRHSERERALPGPTRLIHRAGRFEPIEGFEAFFA